MTFHFLLLFHVMLSLSLSLFAFSFCQLFIIAVVLAFVLCSQEPKIWYPDTYYHGGEH